MFQKYLCGLTIVGAAAFFMTTIKSQPVAAASETNAAAVNPLTEKWTGPYGGVPPFDKVKLRHAIDRLVSDSALRRSMGEAGRRFALLRFDAAVMVDALEHLYASIVPSRVDTLPDQAAGAASRM